MGIGTYLTHKFVFPIAGNTISTIVAIVAGGIVYGLMLFLTGTLMEEDFLLLPGGDRIVVALRKFSLLK